MHRQRSNIRKLHSLLIGMHVAKHCSKEMQLFIWLTTLARANGRTVDQGPFDLVCLWSPFMQMFHPIGYDRKPSLFDFFLRILRISVIRRGTEENSSVRKRVRHPIIVRVLDNRFGISIFIKLIHYTDYSSTRDIHIENSFRYKYRICAEYLSCLAPCNGRKKTNIVSAMIQRTTK